MSSMNLTRINRLLKLIGLLQAGRGRNINSLALECQVSRRTVFRDFELLRQAGLPLEFDDQRQGHRISGSNFLPPTNFTAEEALAVLLLCNELGDQSRLPFLAPARSAAAKLESALPARIREELRDVAGSVEIELEPRNPLIGKLPYYQQLLSAAAQRRAVRIAYDSFAEQQIITTKLSPYRLLFSRRSWYVIGRSSVHRDTRTFNVGRIGALSILDDRFTIPARFNIDRYLGNAWHLIPEPGPDQTVLVRFDPLVARNVAEVNWHKTQQATFNADGSLDFTVTVSGLNEISWWILGYGDQAEVLRPAALRELIYQRARRMAEKYQPVVSNGHVPRPHAVTSFRAAALPVTIRPRKKAKPSNGVAQ